MGKQILLFTVLLFSASASLLLTREHQSGLGQFVLETKTAANKGGLNRAQIAEQAAKWRFDRLKDENGNYYPYYYGQARTKADDMIQSGLRSGIGLQWQELGPDNVGGRTRAILIDKRDSTNQTIYAGGVSGGMWKSYDGGNTWNQLVNLQTGLHNWNQWLAIACITQGPDNTVFIGTGVGLDGITGSSMYSGTMGNGIFKLDANDNPIQLTQDIYNDNYLSPAYPWAAVNRIAVNPNNAQQIIAATLQGLYQSVDEGATWQFISLTGNISGLESYMADDVKWSKNGDNVYASLTSPGSGTGYLLVSRDGGDSWAKVSSTTNSGFPTVNLGRIEIALAPSDDSILYLSIAAPSGCTYAVFRSADAGATWADIGNNGPLFDPMTGECQGGYDNTIAVNPANPNKIYNGGVNFYTWSNEIGWSLADAGLLELGGANDVNPKYIHPDKHAIVFADNDSNTMYVGCDGGIYKSTDAADKFPFPNYSVKNNGYNVTQNYGIAAGIAGDVLGGSQDNGTNYINYLGNTSMAAQEVIGGDGIFTAISHINPEFYFGGVYFADLERSGNGGAGGYSTFYDIKIDPAGIGSASVCGNTTDPGGDAQFITPFLLGETKTAADSFKKVAFGATANYNTGDVITAQSAVANYPFQVTLSAPLSAGDTLDVIDPVRSRIFLSTYCGVWLTSDALNLNIIPRWFKLSNSMTGTPESFANSTDGDVLYVGTDAGYVYRFPNLNVRCDTTSYPPGSTVRVIYPSTNGFTYKNICSLSIEGVAVDPNNKEHVVAVAAGFSAIGQPHVFESNNGGLTWKADTAGLPNMPVYTVAIHDSTTFIIGTELGMWSWDGSQWTEENNGDFPRMPAYRIIETNLYTDGCPVLYLGTHGRGMWRSTTLTPAGCNTQVASGVSNIKNNAVSGLNIFPNPVNASAHISVILDAKAVVTLRIFDMTGKLYSETAYTNIVSGENLFPLGASGLNSGTYLLAATVAGGRTESRLFVVAK